MYINLGRHIIHILSLNAFRKRKKKKKAHEFWYIIHDLSYYSLQFYFYVFVVLFAAGFRSLLFEACGRLVNPVDDVVGMLGRGKFEVCKKAVDMVLAGGTVTPIPYTPHQPPTLTLSLGPITTNPSSGSSSNNDEKKTFDLFK